MSKNFNISLLLDFYGEMLTKPQKEALDCFYNSDLSLSEIAEISGITRQGVRDRIVKGEQTITELENKLGLAKRFENIEQDVSYMTLKLREIEKKYGIDVSELINTAEKIKNR